MFLRFRLLIVRKSKLVELRSEIKGVAPRAEASPPSWAMRRTQPSGPALGKLTAKEGGLWTERSAAEVSFNPIFPRGTTKVPAVPNDRDWMRKQVCERKGKGRAGFPGNAGHGARRPVSDRSRDRCSDTVTHLGQDRLDTGDSGQRAGWNTLGTLISLISTWGLRHLR